MLLDCARAWKEHVEALKRLGPSSPRELAKEIEARLEKQLERILQTNYSVPFPDSPFNFPYISGLSQWPPSDEDVMMGSAEWLHFRRFGESVRQTTRNAKRGDLKAYKRIDHTLEDIYGWHCGQQIKPFEGNLDHNSLLEIGLPLGLDKLSEEEIADFFDDYCPCRGAHDPNALGKLRRRLVAKLLATHSVSQPAQPRPGPPGKPVKE